MHGTLLYDGDCGFCMRSVGWARRLGARAEFRSWQSYPDLAPLGLTAEQLSEAAYFVEGTRTWRGHEAVARTLLTSRHAAVRVLGRIAGLRVLRPLLAPAYALVARNRHRLPGGSPTCTL